MRRTIVLYLPRALRYLRPYRWLLGVTVILTIIGSGLALAAPWPLALLVDNVLVGGEPPALIAQLFGTQPGRLIIVAVIAGFVVTLLTNAVSVADVSAQVRLEQRMILDLRSDLLAHVQRLSLAFHEDQRKGALMFAINNQASAVGEVVTSLLPLAQAAFTLAGMFLIAFALSPILALVSLTIVPFVYSFTGVYGRRIEPRLRRVRDLEGSSLSIVHEAMAMMRVIVAFGRERHEHRRFTRQGREAVEGRINVTVAQTAFSLGVNVLTAAGTALVLGIGAYQVRAGTLTIGQLLVVLSYIAAVYQPLEQISGTIARLQERLIALEAAIDLLDREPEVQDPPNGRVLDRCQGRIEFEGVHFSYRERQRTLADISFEVGPGKTVAIVGPTGAGKSTLVSLIPRFFDPQQGRVLLDAVDVREIGLESLRRQTSIVLQEPLLFRGTIRDNIRYGRLDAKDEEIITAAKNANAHAFIEALPAKYETVVGEGGAKLSGGERQRIAIARAFLRDAPILILDEPTSSVDSRTEIAILDALKGLAHGRTTFLIAHRLSTVRDADEILVLNGGRIIQRGIHEQLAGSPGLYQQMYQAQMGTEPDTVQASDGRAWKSAEMRSLPTDREEVDLAQGASPTWAAASTTYPGLSPPRDRPNGENPLAAAPSTTADTTNPDGDQGSSATPLLLTEGLPGPIDPQRPKIVILGMMSRVPVAGVIWQTLQYILGFERLGFDVYYVEAHARTPSMLMENQDDDSTMLAANFIKRVMGRFGLDRRWAFHALHADGKVHGMDSQALSRLYRDAAAIINLHGATVPRPEHAAGGRLVYLETDPVQLQIELHDGCRETIEFLEPHAAFFTFAQNYGKPGCLLPVSDRFVFHATRQPLLVDVWSQHMVPTGPAFTTIANWHQPWRTVRFQGEIYHWSKDLEFRRFIDLPGRTQRPLELALAGCDEDDKRLLEQHGWILRDGFELSLDLDSYRQYIQGSFGEFTVAKDQNVRMQSGWFSDRSAAYLAAGRPVVTQDTGFDSALPTGRGLFSFNTLEEARDALDEVAAAYSVHHLAAQEIAHEYFAHDVVLRSLLDRIGLTVGHPGMPTQTTSIPASEIEVFPADLDITPVSKRPLQLQPETVRRVMDQPPIASGPGKIAAPEASVVVVTYENMVLTRLCLETVLGLTTAPPYELIVVDNGSRDATLPYLEGLAERHANVRVIANRNNLGFARAANMGLAASSGRILVLMNNDTIVTPGWLARLARHLSDSTVGLVGPTTNNAPNEARIPAHYKTFGELMAFADGRDNEMRANDMDRITMFCAALRRDVYESVGPIDELYAVGMFEDDDYSLRVRLEKYRIVCAEDVFVHHFGEATIGALFSTGEHHRIFETNRQRFETKWNTSWKPHQRRPDPEYEQLRERLRKMVAKRVPPGGRVLVVSQGDDQLLLIDRRRASHFPAMADGTYTGAHPADSKEAIDQLEAARGSEVIYFVVPETSAWWLEHYGGLTRYLENHGRRIVADADTGVIYRLASTPDLVSSTGDNPQPRRAPRQ